MLLVGKKMMDEKRQNDAVLQRYCNTECCQKVRAAQDSRVPSRSSATALLQSTEHPETKVGSPQTTNKQRHPPSALGDTQGLQINRKLPVHPARIVQKTCVQAWHKLAWVLA